MKRFLLQNGANIRPGNLFLPSSISVSTSKTISYLIYSSALAPSCSSSNWQFLRFYSSGSDLKGTEKENLVPETSAVDQLKMEKLSAEAKDVPTKEFRKMMESYFASENEEALPSIMEAAISRRLSKKHDKTDDEMLDKLEDQPFYYVDDEDIEEDFEKLYKTDEEIDNLYEASAYVDKKMLEDEFYNVDDKKWDGMIKELMDAGYMRDTRECEEVLEDMLYWDKLLPDEIKKSVEEKLNELEAMCDRGEVELEEARTMFQQFEDEIVKDYCKKTESEEQQQRVEKTVSANKKALDDPPGEGPILRWQTRVVFSPGGDAWHPKNRKVKLAVTVKDLCLSKHQSMRLRGLVGKRYDAGRDELTITSERFEHREENRKDCLRTLLALIEEAGKADKLASDARVAYAIGRLKANPSFMRRLRPNSSSPPSSLSS